MRRDGITLSDIGYNLLESGGVEIYILVKLCVLIVIYFFLFISTLRHEFHDYAITVVDIFCSLHIETKCLEKVLIEISLVLSL